MTVLMSDLVLTSTCEFFHHIFFPHCIEVGECRRGVMESLGSVADHGRRKSEKKKKKLDEKIGENQ